MDCSTCSPVIGIAANEIEATGGCLLASGSPCAQTIVVTANGPTDGSGQTTITIDKAAGCCADLQVRARGVSLSTLTYRSYDYTADLVVDLSDLGFLAGTFGRTREESGYNACFDFNCDDTVDLSDLGYFATHYNHSCK